MNLKFKITLVLLSGVGLLHTACKKNDKYNPQPPVDSLKTVSTQIAGNIAQSLAGTYGGINLSDGLVIPGFATKSNAKAVITGLMPLCSFFPDTVVSYDTNKSDTLKSHTSGKFKFYFGCDTATVNKIFTYTALRNYACYDSLATTGTSPGKSFIYNTIQFFQSKAMDTTNKELIINGSASRLISVNGSMKSFNDVTDTKNAKNSFSVHAYYNLTGLTVDLSKNGDITGGTSTFAASGSFNNIKWYYAGSIKFLGGHKARILINNKTYDADLLTGTTTIVP